MVGFKFSYFQAKYTDGRLLPLALTRRWLAKPIWIRRSNVFLSLAIKSVVVFLVNNILRTISFKYINVSKHEM